MGTHEGKRSDATRKALLAAAREEFAAEGLAGARVDRIAEAAGVNKERIYGIFGSKDKLFDTVIVDVMQEFTEMVDPLWGTGDVGAFVGSLYDYQQTKPQLLRLLAWEALHRGADAHDVDGWRTEHYRLKLEGAMAHFGTDDPFRAGLMTLVICGIPNWLNLVQQLRQYLLGARWDDAAAIKAFIVSFAEGAAQAMGAGTGLVNDLTGAAEQEAGGDAEAEADAKPTRALPGPYPSQANGTRARDIMASDESSARVRPGPTAVEFAAHAASSGSTPDAVAVAAERLRRAQAEAEAAKDALGKAMRVANAEGISANRLAKQVAGTVSRPVVLKLLSE